MLKKLLCTMLCVVLIGGLFTACNSGKEETSNEVQKENTTTEKTKEKEAKEEDESAELDHLTLRLYFPGDKRPETDAVWKHVEELTKDRLNASFEVNFVPWNDYADKIQLLISSGDDYDFNFDGSWLMYPKMVNKNAYMDLKELAPKYMPNYYKELEKRGYVEAAMVDGNMYCIPWTPLYNNKPFLSWEEDKLGVAYDKKVTTMEEMDGFLNTVIKKFPEKRFVISTDAPLTQTGWMLYSKYEYAKWDFHGLTYDLNDNKVKLIPVEQTDLFKETAKWNSKWVEDGIIPTDALGNRDKYFNASDELKIGQLNTMEYIYYDNNNHKEGYKFYEMYPGNKFLARSPIDNISAINSNAANPERMLMFLDILATDQEVYDAVMYGVEGLTYQVKDGSYEFPEGISNDTSNYLDWSGQWGLWRDYFIRPSGARTKEHYEVNNEFAQMDQFVVSPIAGFFPDTEPIKNEIARRDAIFQEYGLPILFGLVDDNEAAIAEYVQKQKAAGLDKILEELQRQVDAYLAK